jgi:hypothetical protein
MAETEGLAPDNYIKVTVGQGLDTLLLFVAADHVGADARYRAACERAAQLRRASVDNVRLSVYRKVARWPEVAAVGEWRCGKCSKGPNDCSCAKGS